MTKKLIIGSRGSDLALWQAHFFQNQLIQLGLESEIKIITTKGDRIQHVSLDKIEGKGFFTKEIEDALLAKEIDVAVHSHKDLETQQPKGLCIGAVSYREDARELILIREGCTDFSRRLGFPENAIVGTSSVRRKSQIMALRPDAIVKDIRGNVPTRVEKLRSGDYDAILLAAAGVARLQLDLSGLHAIPIDHRIFVPAPAQGVLAFQCRDNDEETKGVLKQMNKESVGHAISIERTVLSEFGGGCHAPLGVYAEPKNDGFQVWLNVSERWEDFPNRAQFFARNANDARLAFRLFRYANYPKRVFISRHEQDVLFLKRALSAKGSLLHGESLIEIRHLPFKVPTGVQWIFFTSPNAVRSFAKTHVDQFPSSYSYATLGEGTERELAHYGLHADFSGGHLEPEQAAEEFAKRLGQHHVFFPISSISKRTVQAALNPSRCAEAIAYETIERSVFNLPLFDAYVLTSPSNVRAFFASGNQVRAGATTIAMGKSTASTLSEFGVTGLTATLADEVELFSLLAQPNN